MSTHSLLIVDDDPNICELIKDVAEGQGFDVRTASSRDQFKRLYWSFNPSLIILDLQMPRGDGIELLRFLGADGCRAQILVVSGMDSRVLVTANRLGLSRGLRMLGVLEKPFAIDDLEAMLRRATGVTDSLTETDLRRAIDNDELMVHYHPKVNLRDMPHWRIDEAEALVRWRHPERGTILPNAFIPLAEKTGLIQPLTEAVLRMVAQQLKDWRDVGMRIAVAVNLAPQLLFQLQFPDRIADLLDSHNIDHTQLTVEITESAAMTEKIGMVDVLTRFRVKNFNLAIDDFGTGYSSLIELYRAPFNELKIDKSFVRDLGESKESDIIVRAIINLAHHLGLSVCAEGVESLSVAERLQEYGCEKIQGYLISRPIAAAEFAALVRSRREIEPA